MLKSLLRSQSSNEQEQQRLEANLQSQQKEELIIEKKTLAGKLQNYLTVSQMRYEPGVEIGSQVQVSIFYFWFLPFVQEIGKAPGNTRETTRLNTLLFRATWTFH